MGRRCSRSCRDFQTKLWAWNFNLNVSKCGTVECKYYNIVVAVFLIQWSIYTGHLNGMSKAACAVIYRQVAPLVLYLKVQTVFHATVRTDDSILKYCHFHFNSISVKSLLLNYHPLWYLRNCDYPLVCTALGIYHHFILFNFISSIYITLGVNLNCQNTI